MRDPFLFLLILNLYSVITIETTEFTDPQVPVFNNSPIKVIILSLVTCGIYLIYWNIKASEVLNAVAGRPVISQPIAILAGLCTPVTAYFYYLIGKDVNPVLAEKVGPKASPMDATILAVIGFFIPLVAAFFTQSEINKLYEE
ncbi:MAG: DUF4234 domain-containing protein [Candidatus Azobacteroides sp.]|nr:DUF4234 domain-containing protein [Candidatus Azobacteroides sp.]